LNEHLRQGLLAEWFRARTGRSAPSCPSGTPDPIALSCFAWDCGDATIDTGATSYGSPALFRQAILNGAVPPEALDALVPTGLLQRWLERFLPPQDWSKEVLEHIAAGWTHAASAAERQTRTIEVAWALGARSIGIGSAVLGEANDLRRQLGSLDSAALGAVLRSGLLKTWWQRFPGEPWDDARIAELAEHWEEDPPANQERLARAMGREAPKLSVRIEPKHLGRVDEGHPKIFEIVVTHKSGAGLGLARFSSGSPHLADLPTFILLEPGETFRTQALVVVAPGEGHARMEAEIEVDFEDRAVTKTARFRSGVSVAVLLLSAVFGAVLMGVAFALARGVLGLIVGPLLYPAGQAPGWDTPGLFLAGLFLTVLCVAAGILIREFMKSRE
jgi:hypothetical protein